MLSKYVALILNGANIATETTVVEKNHRNEDISPCNVKENKTANETVLLPSTVCSLQCFHLLLQT